MLSTPTSRWLLGRHGEIAKSVCDAHRRITRTRWVVSPINSLLRMTGQKPRAFVCLFCCHNHHLRSLQPLGELCKVQSSIRCWPVNSSPACNQPDETYYSKPKSSDLLAIHPHPLSSSPAHYDLVNIHPPEHPHSLHPNTHTHARSFTHSHSLKARRKPGQRSSAGVKWNGAP